MIKIRKAAPKDYQKIKEIKTEFLFWEAKRDKGIDTSRLKRMTYLLRGKLKRNDMAFFLAEDQGKVIGFAWAEIKKMEYFWSPYPKKGYLHDIYVKKQYRRKGLGQKLIKECFKWFQKKNLKYWGVAVHEWNKGAKNLYKKKGFQEHVTFMRIIKK